MSDHHVIYSKFSMQEFILIAGVVLFAVLVILTNFFGNAFYNFDMYSDQLFARLASEEGTIFPSNWIFGNQYYVIATPVLAGILNIILQNSFLAMATASTIMFLITIAVFYWCFHPFLDRFSLLTGTFCLSGAVILGDSASSHIAGFQLFYTMASYYACYVIVILYTVGIWLRLKKRMQVQKLLWISALLLSLALGMQSLREMLVLYIPLIVFDVLSSFRTRKINFSCSMFVLSTFVCNIIGLVIINYCPVKSSPIISDIQLNLQPASVISHFCQSIEAFYQMTGIPYIAFGWKWKILGIIGLFYSLTAVSVLLTILVRRDHSPVASAVRFFAISIAGVLFVGTFLFRVRDIYYFVWFLLLASVFSYLFSLIQKTVVNNILLFSLVFSGAVNLFFNFYPDLVKQKELDSFYSAVAEDLVENDITTIFVDMNTPPTIASISRDKITAITYSYDNNSNTDQLLQPVPFLQAVSYAENPDPEHSLIVLSDYRYSDYSSYEYLELFTSDSYRQQLFNNLELIDERSCNYATLFFYRFSEPGILLPKSE